MNRQVNFIMAFLILSLSILCKACSPKATPVITSRTVAPPKMEKQALDITPDIKEGEVVFTTRCGKCHDLPLPDQYTAKRWEGILSYMIPKAKLNAAQGVHVTAFLKANAEK